MDRFWEVDAARGVAIIMMIVYHTAYDLDTLGGYDIQSTTGYWALFADLQQASFCFSSASRSPLAGRGRA
ncbi:MAG TPA: heparan-alpha-glucosaminide N-acetyltransferase domain-containing protein [Rubrobacter sp.]|nr:heparan-alpha-glucosaminide N-acetyltransferase domain-containing protein [Rubrobacter sp.]